MSKNQNSKKITFVSDLPSAATRTQLEEAALGLRGAGGWIRCFDAEQGEAMESGAGALMIIAFYSFGRTERAGRHP